MSDPRCAEVRDLLAEAALGVLAEPERSEVLAHMESCAGCRRALDELLQVSDRLVALVPEAEPPPGFEHRVLRARRCTGRDAVAMVSVAAAAVVVLARHRARAGDRARATNAPRLSTRQSCAPTTARSSATCCSPARPTAASCSGSTGTARAPPTPASSCSTTAASSTSARGARRRTTGRAGGRRRWTRAARSPACGSSSGTATSGPTVGV